MNKASFVRKVNYQSVGSGFAISSAVFYEDEKRVYAFLTFRNNSTSHVRGCTLRITPYDADRRPMPGFGARIDDLELPINREIEYASPLLLPKDTFAFNWNFFQIEYSHPEKVKDTGVDISNARIEVSIENMSEEAQADALVEQETIKEEVATKTELDDTILKVRSIPLKKIRKKAASKSLGLAMLIPLLVLGAIAAFLGLAIAECGGTLEGFLSNYGQHIEDDNNTMALTYDVFDSLLKAGERR